MKKSVSLLLHGLVITFFVVQVVSTIRHSSSYSDDPLSVRIFDNVFIMGSFLGLVYFSYWVFTLKYYIRKQYIKFFVITVAIISGFAVYLNLTAYFISHILKLKTHIFDSGWMFGMTVGWAIFFGALGTIFRLFVEWIIDSKRKKELEKQNIKSELSFLKSQINPHFLFNSLNNIDSLIGNASPKGSLALNKLADIMRYTVYESDNEFVPLEDEIKYIQNFIALQKLRIPNEDIIKLKISGDLSNKQITPMVLIPFIENAFKHSSLRDKSENKIDILIGVKDQLLNFYCSNQIAKINKDAASGIGLENVKKRLDIIYKGKYTLKINKSDESFIVNLDIKL